MKKVLSIMLVLICFAMVSCSKESSSSAETKAPATVTAKESTAPVVEKTAFEPEQKADESPAVVEKTAFEPEQKADESPAVVEKTASEPEQKADESPAMDETVFEKVDLLDDFGDPTGNSYIKAKKDFDGTYKNIDGVSDGKLKWNIKVEDGKVTFIIKEKGQVNQLSTAYYTTDEFEVKVKDNTSGKTETYTGVVSRGEEGTYNCIEVLREYSYGVPLNDLSSKLYVGLDCKIVISNDRGSYNLGSLNASDVEALFYGVENLNKAGGYIFYDVDADNESGNADGLISSECGWRFLEAAPADLRVVNGVPTVDSSVDGYSSAPEEYAFGYYKSTNGDNLFVNGTASYNEADCTSVALGTGKTNTEKLVSAMGATTDQYAAKLCDDLEYNGYDDWFLPSYTEVTGMYVYLIQKKLGNFKNYHYWTSSEDPNSVHNAIEVATMFFSANRESRDNLFSIRPCRAF